MSDAEQRIAELEQKVKELGREIFQLESELAVEKNLRATLEDVVRATSNVREQA
jgi:hypothetical protein